MAYIDKAFYDTYAPGNDISDDDFAIVSERASDVIDALTMYKITDFDALYSAIQLRVKNATAAQVQEMYGNGWTATGQGDTTQETQVRVGNFSYSTGGKADTCNGISISPLVRSYLMPTGLMYAGVGLCHSRYPRGY